MRSKSKIVHPKGKRQGLAVSKEATLAIKTPLKFSDSISRRLGKGNVYLKLDNLQPTGSFKIRGIGNTCQVAKAKGFKRITGASGGNAGHAMAYAAKQLEMQATICLPKSTPDFMKAKIEALGAEVLDSYKNIDEAGMDAKKMADQSEDTFFVHPNNQESTWIGHSTLVREVEEQLKAYGEKEPASAILTSVGGGGLAIGILRGLKEVGWNKVTKLLASETEGTACFNKSVEAGEVIRLKKVTGVATSLAVLECCPELLEMYKSEEYDVHPVTISDRLAITSVFNFIEDERILVEPACGTALAPIYFPKVIEPSCSLGVGGPVIIVICGGSLVNFELLKEWDQQFKQNKKRHT